MSSQAVRQISAAQREFLLFFLFVVTLENITVALQPSNAEPEANANGYGMPVVKLRKLAGRKHGTRIIRTKSMALSTKNLWLLFFGCGFSSPSRGFPSLGRGFRP